MRALFLYRRPVLRPARRIGRLARVFTLLLGLGGLLAGGCELINPEEEIPAYVSVGEPRLVLPTGDTVTGTLPDVWLLQEGNYLGTFPMPVTVPVLDKSTERFFLLPGVWKNASTDEHTTYPFIQADTALLQLSARDTAVVQPLFRYFPDSVLAYRFVENFEDVGLKFDQYRPSSPGVTIQSSEDAPFEGERCGIVRLDTTEPRFEMYTSVPMFLPRGQPIWLEVTYRGNVKFGFSLYHEIPGSSPGSRIPQLTPLLIPNPPVFDDEWQTVFIDLRPMVNSTLATSEQRLYFVSSLPAGRTESTLYLDNIRIIHYAD